MSPHQHKYKTSEESLQIDFKLFFFVIEYGMVEGDPIVASGDLTEVDSEDQMSKPDKFASEMFCEPFEQSDSEPNYSWLHVELAEFSIHHDHIIHCEDVLIVREGFTSKAIFASVPTSKINYEYLETIGITHLGIQSVILAVHKKVCEEVSCSELAKVPIPVVKWLRSKLNAAQTLPQLQKECEWKLVVQEGITSKDLFASLPENVFNVAYLRRIGIEAVGMQHVLLEWHAELHCQYIQQLNYLARNRTVTGAKTGHKRRAERSSAGDGPRDSQGASINLQQGPSHKRTRNGEEEIDID